MNYNTHCHLKGNAIKWGNPEKSNVEILFRINLFSRFEADNIGYHHQLHKLRE